MKTCPGCGISKPTTEFNKSALRKDGLQVHCRICNHNYRITHSGAAQEANRRFLQNNPEKKEIYNRTTRKNNAAKIAAAAKRHREANPAQEAARSAIGSELRAGRLVSLPCWECGARGEAHHPSYALDMRLNVIWLCRKHHMEVHREVKVIDGLPDGRIKRFRMPQLREDAHNG